MFFSDLDFCVFLAIDHDTTSCQYKVTMEFATHLRSKDQQDKLAALLAKAGLNRLYPAFVREKVGQFCVCVCSLLGLEPLLHRFVLLEPLLH